MRHENKIKETVTEYYEAVASERITVRGNAKEITQSLGYGEELQSVPQEADLGLGCGNPNALAKPALGETVLDLGSGRGLDCFIASKAVGPDGRVFGVDASPAMVKKAAEIAVKKGFTNCSFLYGECEHIPLAEHFIDLVISNCVINLSVDKPKVYAEIHRVLRNGGRAAISDITLKKELPVAWRKNPAMVRT